MDHIKIKSVKFKLAGESIKIGDSLSFKAKDKHNNDFEISSIKGKKIISIFPDINTKICDMQTHNLAMLAAKNQGVNFVSITMDDIEVISKWCAANHLENLEILSDLEYKEFATKTNLFIPMIKKLSRGFILLDENNVVEDLVLNDELAELPDFNKVNEWIAKNIQA